jgi:16S rRNA (adenine1518-N6/adenine1519-N6)-dimethyltransferase
MSLPSLDVPDLLRRYNLRPDQSLGQNFLVDAKALQQVVDAAELSPNEDVLEIGPGLGSLTRLLVMQARRVVAVELDTRFIPVLHEVLADLNNVKIIEGDILQIDPVATLTDNTDQITYQVVANIPYYITSAVIRHLLEARVKPETVTLTIQQEVAERICAAPGKMSLLALSVQVYGAPQIAAYIPAGAFYPPPKVASAVVHVDIFPNPAIPPDLLRLFFRLAKAGFSQKRKNLRNAISGGMAWKPKQAEELLEAAGIDPRRRAETLSLSEWQCLAENVRELTPQPE